MKQNQLNSEFAIWINSLKEKVHSARQKIAFSINSQLLELYWEIGKEVNEKITNAHWGTNVIEKIATELSSEFPDIKGFSRRNIYAIRQWYLFYAQKYEFVPQAVAQIPWGHNRLIISKIKDLQIAEFYAEQCLKNAWDRDTLEIQIKSSLHNKIGSSSNNFQNTLSQTQSKLANETLKDPYNFDFLGLQEDALEKVVEDELTKHLTKFLLELGEAIPENLKYKLPSIEELENELEK
jgi:hypothetical protein